MGPLWNRREQTRDVEHGFLRFHPLQTKTPKPNIWMPPGMMEVTKRTESQQSWVNGDKRKQSKYSLRDYVFFEILEDFYWDRASCIEFKAPTIHWEETDENDILYQDNREFLESYGVFGWKEADETEQMGTLANYEIG